MNSIKCRQEEIVNLLEGLRGSGFQALIKTEGHTSRFRNGIVHRFPGMPAMIEVAGTHYEMGLQYGTLLLPEIKDHLYTNTTLLNMYAAEAGVSAEDYLVRFSEAAAYIARNLPTRFLEELQGIADGSGLALSLVTAFALTYDVFMVGGCTGLLMKTASGRVIHGRTNDTDTFGGIEFAKNYLIIRTRPEGYRTITHISYPLNPGVTNGYSNAGLTFSEETLHVKQSNPHGYSISYLARTYLEENSSMDGFDNFLETHPRIGGYGTVWSEQQAGKGFLFELAPDKYRKTEVQEPLFWNLNHYYNDKLKELEIPSRRLFADADREEIAESFKKKQQYTVEDAVQFLRQRKNKAGIDFSCIAHRKGIANEGTTMMTIFDPQGDGFYFALGPSFASCQTVYHLPDTFNERPEAIFPAENLDSTAVLIAAAAGRIRSPQEMIDEYKELLLVLRDKPQIHYRIAEAAKKIGQLARFANHAYAAAEMAPEIPEYRSIAEQAKKCLTPDS